MLMLHNGLQVDYSVYKQQLALVCLKTFSSCILDCKHMTLAISILNYIFPLLTNMQNGHLKYPNVMTLNVIM